ncbi:hypothetical protein M514_05399 [Trichuris suis]|uniref:PTPRJ transmembrane domain-containing protein n=1 Tax=Trichuris suis TaxID=68888 RepID=A0A085NSG0_9BILA|nr:hypothetical protein M513_05399 [Trichuris suis]KFD72406.1 hypothetical protein M514_05399 [Trichuris suis]
MPFIRYRITCFDPTEGRDPLVLETAKDNLLIEKLEPSSWYTFSATVIADDLESDTEAITVMTIARDVAKSVQFRKVDQTIAAVSFGRGLFPDSNGVVDQYYIIITEDEQLDKFDAYHMGWKSVQKYEKWPPYLAYSVKQNPFSNPKVQSAEYLIGAEDCYNELRYCNGPLRAASQYFVKVQGCTVAMICMETGYIPLTSEAVVQSFPLANDSIAVIKNIDYSSTGRVLNKNEIDMIANTCCRMSDFEELTEATSWYSLSVYSVASALLYAENIRNAMLEQLRRLLPFLRSKLFVLHITLLLTYLLVASMLTLCEQALQLEWDAVIATEATQRRDMLLQKIADLHYQLDEGRIPFTSWFNESISLLIAYESQLEATKVMTSTKRSFRQLLLLLLASITTAGFKAQGPLSPAGRLVLVALFFPGIYLFLTAACRLGRLLSLTIYSAVSFIGDALSVSKKVLLHLLSSLIFTALLSAASVYVIECGSCNSMLEAIEAFIYGSLFIGTGRCVTIRADEFKLSLVGIPLYSATMFWFFVCTVRSVRQESLLMLKHELPGAICKSNLASKIQSSELEYVDIHSKVMESLRTLPDGAWMLQILDSPSRCSLDRTLLRLVSRRERGMQTDATVKHVAVQVGRTFS